MRRTFVLALATAFVCAYATTAAALVVNINGPSDVWVPFEQCVTVTWTASPSGLETFDWTWNSTQVSSASSYSRTWCSPGFDYATSDYGTLGLYATSGGSADYDSMGISIIFEAGNENGGCGIQAWC